MSTKQDWLWDRKINLRKARNILGNPQNKHFLSLAALLLARNNSPQEVFKGYLKPRIFLSNWRKIKKQMRNDSWNNPRIEFWQAVYEKLNEKYKKRGFIPAKESCPQKHPDDFCRIIAAKIRTIRKQKRLTQNTLAKKIGISQQVISRIEGGRENISLLTLKKIIDSLGTSFKLEILPQR